MFRKEVAIINTIITSREIILKGCRDIVSEKGLSAVNMRSVAEHCGVALGSLYNYFPSKDALILATIESVWENIFHMDNPCQTTLSFVEYVNWIFETVRRGTEEYPNFFTAHSLSFANREKDKAKNIMEHYFSHIKLGMMEALNSDTAVRKDAFSSSFPKSDFPDFVLMNLLACLIQKKNNCTLLLELIRRAIYTT